MVTFEELEKFDARGLPLKTRLDAFFKGTEVLNSFIETVIIPVIQGQIGLNKKEKALVETYYRMVLWLRTVVKLNHPMFFQATASSARSLYELFLDLNLLINDKTGADVEKYHYFPKVEKFRAAEILITFSNAHPGKIKRSLSHQKRFINKSGRKKEIESSKFKFWGNTKKGKPKTPPHWSGLTIKDLAIKLGPDFEGMYVETYPNLSWYIHSGSTGFSGLSKEALESCFGLCHSLFQRMLIQSTFLIAKELKIKEGLEGLLTDSFGNIIEDLKLKPGQFIVEEQIKILEKKDKA